MRKLLVILFTLFLQNSFATNYYVSATGSDSNDGLTSSTPWQTLTKVNATTFSPGDNIFFLRGGTWYGTLVAKHSGSAGNPITYASYGVGTDPAPIITGFTTVSSWTNLGSNIWESTSAVSTLSDAKIVVINGKNTNMGHTPNIQSDGFRPNYYPFQSHSGNISITSSSLSGTPDWTGADVVIRIGSYVWNKATITSQSSGTLNFAAITTTPIDNYGFWIQNDIRTLDTANEWYYNPSTKKLAVYSTSMPTDVKITTVDTLFNNNNYDYISVNNLDFEGANNTAIACHGTAYFTVDGCSIHFVGRYGIDYNHSASYATITNNDFADIVQYGFFNQDYTGAANISNNNFKRINLITPVFSYDESSGAITQVFPYSTIEYNRVDSFGRKGIIFRGKGVDVGHNYITNGALTRQDAGGIYTGFENEPSKSIHDNIIVGMVGNIDGMPSGSGYGANGIYCDDWSDSTMVINNSIANVASAGIFLHNTYYDTVTNNTVYNHSTAGSFTKGGLMIQTDASKQTHPTRNNRITKNVFFATAANRYAIFSYNNVSTADSKLYGYSDSNYYENPIASDVNMFNFYDYTGSVSQIMDLPAFRTYIGYDAASVGSPRFTSSTDSIRFVYNPTNTDSIVSLGYIYVNAKGVTFNSGSITLQPFTSAILIYVADLPNLPSAIKTRGRRYKLVN